ncbi:MAG: hypothetical protein WD872_02975 [Pirellulaceae bacterium]
MNNPPDTILEELHATRRRLLKEHGGVAGLAAFLRQEEAKSNRPIAESAADAGPDEAPSGSGNEPTV